MKLGSSEQFARELIMFLEAVELTNIVVIRSTGLSFKSISRIRKAGKNMTW